jgi:hypothetical protein
LIGVPEGTAKSRPEGTGQAAAVHRAIQQQVAGRDASAVGAVGGGLLGLLAFDALHVVRIRIDLARILQRDVLGLVFLGADLEGH